MGNLGGVKCKNFRNTVALTTIIVTKIKEDAHLYALVGAKHLSDIMSRE